MAEIIAIIANIITILSGLVSIFSTRRARIISLVIFAFFGLIGTGTLIYIWISDKPTVTVVTSFTSFENGYYKARQQQFYSYPFSFKSDFPAFYIWPKKLKISYSTGGNEGNEPVAKYSMYIIGSDEIISSLKLETKKDYDVSTEKNRQIFFDVNFYDAISVSEDNEVWHQPIGWAGLGYYLDKIYPAHEIIIILDFRELKLKEGQKTHFRNPPRFLIVNQYNPKPDDIKEEGEDLMKNRYKEMDVLRNSEGLVWFLRIKNPPQGWVLLKWEPI